MLKAKKTKKAKAIGVIKSLHFKIKEIDIADIALGIGGAIDLSKAGLGNLTTNSLISIAKDYIANVFRSAIGWLGNIKGTS